MASVFLCHLFPIICFEFIFWLFWIHFFPWIKSSLTIQLGRTLLKDTECLYQSSPPTNHLQYKCAINFIVQNWEQSQKLRCLCHLPLWLFGPAIFLFPCHQKIRRLSYPGRKIKKINILYLYLFGKIRFLASRNYSANKPSLHLHPSHTISAAWGSSCTRWYP